MSLGNASALEGVTISNLALAASDAIMNSLVLSNSAESTPLFQYKLSMQSQIAVAVPSAELEKNETMAEVLRLQLEEALCDGIDGCSVTIMQLRRRLATAARRQLQESVLYTFLVKSEAGFNESDGTLLSATEHQLEEVSAGALAALSSGGFNAVLEQSAVLDVIMEAELSVQVASAAANEASLEPSAFGSGICETLSLSKCSFSIDELKFEHPPTPPPARPPPPPPPPAQPPLPPTSPSQPPLQPTSPQAPLLLPLNLHPNAPFPPSSPSILNAPAGDSLSLGFILAAAILCGVCCVVATLAAVLLRSKRRRKSAKVAPEVLGDPQARRSRHAYDADPHSDPGPGDSNSLPLAWVDAGPTSSGSDGAEVAALHTVRVDDEPTSTGSDVAEVAVLHGQGDTQAVRVDGEPTSTGSDGT